MMDRRRALMAKKDTLAGLKPGTYNWKTYWSTVVDATGLATTTVLEKPTMASKNQVANVDLTRSVTLHVGDGLKIRFHRPGMSNRAMIFGNVFSLLRCNAEDEEALIINTRLYFEDEYTHTMGTDVELSALYLAGTNGLVAADTVIEWYIEIYVNDVLVVGR